MDLLSVALMSVAHFSLELGDGGIPLLLPLLKEKLGVSHALVGIVVMARLLGSSAMQPVFGVWADVQWSRWLLPVSTALAASGVACLGYCPGYLAVLAATFTGGLGTAAFHPASSMAVYHGAGRNKASAMAVFTVCGNVGYALGPALMSFVLRKVGLRGTVYVLFAGAASSGTVLAAGRFARFDFSRETSRESRQNLCPRGLLSKPVVLLTVFAVLRSVVHMGLVTYLPFYYPKATSGVAVTLFLLTGALGTLLGGALADRRGTRFAVVWPTALSVPLCIGFMLASGPWDLVFLALFGLSILATSSVTTVMCQNLMPHNVGLASGLMTGFGYGVAGLALVLVGYLVDALGVRAAFWSLCLATLATFLLAVWCPSEPDSGNAGSPPVERQSDRGAFREAPVVRRSRDRAS